MKCTRRPAKRLAERDSIRGSRTKDDIWERILHLDVDPSIHRTVKRENVKHEERFPRVVMFHVFTFDFFSPPFR
jgi:hypothetical protein